MVTRLLTEPMLAEAGIPRKSWECTLKQLPPKLRDRLREYTAEFDTLRTKGTGLLLFGEDTEDRECAYYATLKALMAQERRVKSVTVMQLTDMWFKQRGQLQGIVEEYDVLAITELNLSRELMNAGVVTAVVYAITERCTSGLPVICCSSLEMEFPQDGLSTRYAGIAMMERCCWVVTTDEQPPQSAWLDKHTRGRK